MRSLMAALRTLVLPFGTTSGLRIVLDGETGTIKFYDASNNLVMELNGSTFVRVTTPLSSQTFLSSRALASGFPEFSLTTQGTLSWGGGSGIVDTQLLREAASLLRTPDSFQVDGDILDANGDKIFHEGDFSGTTSTLGTNSGSLDVTHGAGFTPARVVVQPVSPASGSPVFTSASLTQKTSTTFRIRCWDAIASAVVTNGTSVSGHYVCYP